MKKTYIQIYKSLQEWFDPSIEGSPYKTKEFNSARVLITLKGIAQKTVCIVR